MKIYQFLEQLFKLRILSDDQIPQYMRKVSLMGKFDQPKQNAILTELLVRVAKLEDRTSQVFAVNSVIESNPLVPNDVILAIDTDKFVMKKKGGRPKGSKNIAK